MNRPAITGRPFRGKFFALLWQSKMRFSKIKIGAGFTLVEIIVVTTVISILTLFTIANYGKGQKQFTLQRAAHKLAQDIRLAQEMAMSSKECQECGGGIPSGYGVFFNELAPNNSSYVIYADTLVDQYYTAADYEIEIIDLEPGVIILDVKDFNQISINFKPPDPIIDIKDGLGSSVSTTEITIALESDSSILKTIIVNTAGLIDID
jgi:prepilin-type N-terminal cleavage/methylation domain-containing protein